MKYIKIPTTVDLINVLNGERMKDDKGNDATRTFQEHVRWLLMDRRFATGMEAVFKAMKITKALDEVANDGGDWLALEDADFDLLKQVNETPAAGYDPRFAVCIVSFMEAIANATSEKPKELHPAIAPEQTTPGNGMVEADAG